MTWRTNPVVEHFLVIAQERSTWAVLLAGLVAKYGWAAGLPDWLATGFILLAAALRDGPIVPKGVGGSS